MSESEPFVNWRKVYDDQIAAMRREDASLKARVAKCLSEIEWDSEKPCPDGKSCPWCCATGFMEVGVDTEWQYEHEDDCELAALLRECGGVPPCPHPGVFRGEKCGKCGEDVR